MTILARQCKCGAPMRHARVQTHEGEVDLFVCPKCDRRKCEHCHRPTGRLLAATNGAPQRCQHSDCRKELAWPGVTG